MQDAVWLDWTLAGIAIAILSGGMLLLLSGILNMNKK
jgi:hypothetical protein